MIRTIFRRLALVALFLAIAIGAPRAQDADMRAMSDRLDRLQNDVMGLQRQVYRGGPPPSGGGAPSALSGDSQGDAARAFNGRIEELGNQVNQLKAQLDKMQSDVDLRLNALEQGQGAAPRGGNPPPNGTVKLTPPPGAAPQGAAASPPAADQTVALPSGSAQDQYNYAFGLLRGGNYPGAEQAFRAFVAKNPKDALAGNAQYWLGETFYVRQDWNNAAIAFAEAYQKYPKSPKAPDDLLKLGMSLGNLNQKANACSAFARLERDFTTPPANIKAPLASEKQRLGC